MYKEKGFILKPEMFSQEEWYEMYIKLLKEYQQNYNTIKEIREYIEKHIAIFKDGDMLVDMNINELLKILDKEGKDE